MNDWDTIHSSKSMEWRTPPGVFDTLDREFGFEVDAAASPANALCDLYWTEDDDALSLDWSTNITSASGTGPTVFLNPPYGRGVGVWVGKAIEQQAKGCTVVMVLMACTDTKWWAKLWGSAHEVRFVTGRIRFLDREGKEQGVAPKGTAIVVFRSFSNSGSGPLCSLVKINEDRSADTKRGQARGGAAERRGDLEKRKRGGAA